MPKHLPLRPQLYAEKVEALIARAVLEGGSLDLHGEAERIALSCGMSPASARMDFQKTAHFVSHKAHLVARPKVMMTAYA